MLDDQQVEWLVQQRQDLPHGAQVFGADVANDSILFGAGKVVGASVKVSSKTVIPSKLGAVKKADIWSEGVEYSKTSNAFNHWKKHGKNFDGVNNAKEYVELAQSFFRNSPTDTLKYVNKMVI